MEAFLNEFWSDFSRPENFVGHFAYVLLIISMMMRNMNWLRLFAIMAGSISAIFYFTIGDFVSMFWESMFTLVNLAQFVLLQIENRRGKFSTEEETFINQCLNGVERAYARRLMKIGAWTEVQEDVVLFAEDTCPNHLLYIIDGEAEVSRAEQPIGQVSKGDFLGEMSYLTGKKASATVITSKPTRYLAFERGALKAFLERQPEVRYALEASFNRNLVSKLASTSQKSLPTTN